jgi:hypothetical protein
MGIAWSEFDSISTSLNVMESSTFYVVEKCTGIIKEGVDFQLMSLLSSPS